MYRATAGTSSKHCAHHQHRIAASEHQRAFGSSRYLSGEDPFLGYTLVQPVIKGIQDNNVVANAKHYVR